MAASTAAADADAATASGADEPQAACDDSACSTPFVSAPSSPTRDRDRDPYPSHLFFSAPTSPTRGGGKDAITGVLDFDFDFSSRFPSPSAAAMSSADELFHNGQIRPVRLAAALLQPHPDPAALLDFVPDTAAEARGAGAEQEAEADERGRVRSRSLRRKARSMSPFRTHWRSASHAPVPLPEPESADEAKPAATPAASRSSSSSSTASSASSTSWSSSRGSRRLGGFLKDLLHRSKSDGGKTTHHQHQHSHHAAAGPAPPTAAAKASASSPTPSPSPAAAKGRGSGAPGHRGGGRRRSAHERLYEARRAEAEEMRRRTSLPYRQGLLLFGCIGLGNRSYGAVHGLARGLNAAAAVSSRS
ncbi:unnamed protein product [Miscanthus lutarioriparius]|uniref:Calmodulin-binding protein n=1 Tax=Miscanthus lutarioriparius TaxID=422564 RepID=A0A811QAU4_9POAL|nr:unnamed protein product [Miscanthus lutarioriparius]